MTTTTQGQVPTDTNTASGAADLTDTVCKALRRAWQLGQTYWQQADSESFVQHKKSEKTLTAFVALLDDTRAALASAPAQPVAKPDTAYALPEREAIIRAAVAAMPHTNHLVADDLLTGHTMHTEAEDVIAIWKAGAASRGQALSGVLEDAARYRWLREGNDAKHGAAWHVAVNLYGCEWDAAIDAARKQGEKT